MPIWRRLFWHADSRADSRAAYTAGRSSPTSVPMMAMTTSSSTKVKPRRPRITLDDDRALIRLNLFMFSLHMRNKIDRKHLSDYSDGGERY